MRTRWLRAWSIARSSRGTRTIEHHASKRIRLEYNDLYDSNRLNNDAGAIYGWGTDDQGGVNAFNWVDDNPQNRTKSTSAWQESEVSETSCQSTGGFRNIHRLWG